jgi:uroporphyrinogen decarboxylase
MKSSMHSCGSIVDILPDLIECGLDIINPVQVSARGMNPEILKKEFGDKIIFYGGSFDAVSLPVSTSPESVYEQVKRNIEILSRGGGYIFSGVHNIQGNVPGSHLKAILEAFRDVRSVMSYE